MEIERLPSYQEMWQQGCWFAFNWTAALHSVDRTAVYTARFVQEKTHHSASRVPDKYHPARAHRVTRAGRDL